MRQATIPRKTEVQPYNVNSAVNPFEGAQEGLEKISGQLAAAGERVQRRNDVIGSAVASDNFNQDVLKSYNTTLQQGNMLDPNQNTIQNFNIENEQRISNIVSQFNGSDDARATLEANLRRSAGQYADKMIEVQNNQQREFILDKGRKEISPIAAALTKDPGNLVESFNQVDAIAERLALVLDPTSERKFRDAGRSAVMESAVTGLLNGGKYEEASNLLLNNSVLMKYLEPSKRDQFNRRISNFRQTKIESEQELNQKMIQLETLRKNGYNISNKDALKFVTSGEIDQKQTYGEKLEEIRKGSNISQADWDAMPLHIKSALGGRTLPAKPVFDYSRDFLPDGKLSPKGVFGRIKSFMESATKIQEKIAPIEELYKQSKSNSLAGLGVLQGYLKLIDDGAVVRDSDIALAETAAALSDRFQKAINSLTKGEAVSESLVEQAYQASLSFVKRANEVSKSNVDFNLKNSGYSLQQIGYGQDTYNLIFNNVRDINSTNQTAKDKTGSSVVTDGSQPLPTGGAKPKVVLFELDENGKPVAKN